jgi:hypothetical protein
LIVEFQAYKNSQSTYTTGGNVSNTAVLHVCPGALCNKNKQLQNTFRKIHADISEAFINIE